MEALAVTVCPSCGSGKVHVTDSEAKCSTCRWAGKPSEVLHTKIESKGLSSTAFQVTEAVSHAYLLELSKRAAAHIGLAMVSAGLVTANDPINLTRLIRAATLGAHRATLEDIDSMQKELLNVRPDSSQSIH